MNINFKEAYIKDGFDISQFKVLTVAKEYSRLSVSKRKDVWVNRTHCLLKLNKQFVIIVQGLGKIDIGLLNNENKYRDKDTISLSTNTKEFIDAKLNFEHDVIISQLWIFGCYEILRTLTELFGSGGKQFKNVLKQTKATKDEFERLRIPLAKFKPQRDNTDTDYGFGIPVHSPQSGIGWVINDNDILTRNYLAYRFLEVLKFLDENLLK